jgi:mannitol-specific phosphotransferase system IIBC component
MAKKGKKPISKPKKKGSSKKKSSNFITRLIIIIFVLIFAAFFILKFTKNIGSKDKKQTQKTEVVKKQEKKDMKEKMEKKEKKDKEDKKAAETKAVETSITGTWMSTTGGAVLTMKNKEYRLDFMGVDSDAPIIGTYSVDGDLITFVNKKDPCKDVKGLYEVKFNKNEIGFKCKSDECTKRKATLPTEWEWLDTDE